MGSHGVVKHCGCSQRQPPVGFGVGPIGPSSDGDAGTAGSSGISVSSTFRSYLGISFRELNGPLFEYHLYSLLFMQNTFLKKSGSS
jgi:hypothetical protein